MSGKFSEFVQHSVKNFFEALINIFIFLPYFFSVSTLFKTLFAPWKNLVTHKTQRGFSFGDWFNRLGFDMISRGMGFTMRFSIITFYILFQVLYIIIIPFILIIYVLILPFLFIITLSTLTDEEKKQNLKQQFISTHLMQQENYAAVEQWFEFEYNQKYVNSEWWKLKNLFSTPPLARDWAVGYTPILDEFAQDLTNSTYQNHLKTHIVDRKKETQQIEQTLSKAEEANVILVGEDGVGKHTIIEALAKKIYEGTINPLLAYKRVLRLNMEKILTQYLDQQQRETFLESLLQEALEAKNVILLIDDFHKYVSQGPEHVDLTGPIEKYAQTSALQIIAITNPFLYQKFVFTNDKISLLFSKIDIEEIDKTSALSIMLDMNATYESRYKVYIPYETIQTTVDKSDFFITTIPFPEKALQLLDSACVYTTQSMKQTVVTPAVIDFVLSQKTHVPTTLSQQMKDKLLQLEQELTNKIVHQEEAVSELSAALRRSFLLLGKRKKPLASFLFLGPTGVGKTETAKAISQVFFGNEKSLMRFDMSLYQTKADIPKLIGSIETLNPGILTNTIREQPYGVLLLDEIEKADRDLLNIFLTLLDEGYFTDGFGKRVDCKNLVIIATSNAGAEFIFKSLTPVQPTPQPELQQVATKLESFIAENNPNTPFSSAPNPSSGFTTNSLISYLVEQKIFVPEFLNRFDGVVAFRPLQQDSAIMISRKLLSTVIDQVYALYKVKINVSDATLQDITQRGYNPAFGARNLERILRDEIEDKIARLILENKVKEGESINL